MSEAKHEKYAHEMVSELLEFAKTPNMKRIAEISYISEVHDNSSQGARPKIIVVLAFAVLIMPRCLSCLRCLRIYQLRSMRCMSQKSVI